MKINEFRAWGKNLKKMYDVLCIDLLTGKLIISSKDEENPSGWVHSKHFELMQLTGRKDKHGKESYDKDIIKARYYNYNEPDTSLIGVISKEKSLFVFKDKIIDQKSKVSDYRANCPLFYVDEFEILGNIKENPELLK